MDSTRRFFCIYYRRRFSVLPLPSARPVPFVFFAPFHRACVLFRFPPSPNDVFRTAPPRLCCVPFRAVSPRRCYVPTLLCPAAFQFVKHRENVLVVVSMRTTMTGSDNGGAGSVSQSDSRTRNRMYDKRGRPASSRAPQNGELY